ncbi:MAG: xylose isomerase [Phycisphaera sp.]|nr:xylose isomerase [Phycisphaera sp.]
MPKSYFPNVKEIKYEGPTSKKPLAFKHYNANEKVLGKTMRDHFRFAACYWHCMKGAGGDPFGPGTRIMPWNDAPDEMTAAEQTMHAHFEFMTKLGVGFWCFHDRDISPEAGSLAETNKRLDHIVKLAGKMQRDTGIKLLWGTANLFSHPRYMSGAGTSVSAKVFAHAAAQVKKALEVTKELKGSGYVFWGGREGYDSLLNTDMGRELDHLALLLHMAVDYKKKIGFRGQFFIEPKPKEPTKHQYDFDAAACHAFLMKYDLVKDFMLNIETNHATLAGHSMHHELEYAVGNNLLGSIDANRGDTLIGWDTDQFPTDLYDCVMVCCSLLKAGGFKAGGLNFDAKVRRQSIDPVDLFYAHIGGMDTFARALKIAAKIQMDGRIAKLTGERYAGWSTPLGRDIEKGKMNLAKLEAIALKNNVDRAPSGRQELFENVLNELI